MKLAENELFLLRGDNEYLPYANELLKRLNVKTKNIRRFFKISNHPKITIDLFKTNDELHKYVLDTYNEEMEPYSCGGFEDKAIFSEAPIEALEHQMYLVVDNIMHEYTHLVYRLIYLDKFDRVLWLDEGLAQHLSEQKNLLDVNFPRFKSFFLRNIVAKNKEIPHIEDLKEHGTKRGRFNYPRYDGYAISYMLVRYLFAKVRDWYKRTMSEEEFKEAEQSGFLKQMIDNGVYDIVTDPERIKELEKKGILGKMINYYGSKFKIRPSAIQLDRVKTPEELMDYMDVCMTYGWIDKFGRKHRDELKDFKALYKTNSIEEILNSNLGTCIEQAKFQKYMFDRMGLNNKLYVDRRYEKADEKVGIKLHCLTIFERDNRWYYFEHCNVPVRGIKVFDSVDEFIEDYKRKMEVDRILTEVPEIPDGLSYAEFNQYINRCDELESNRRRTN